MSEWDQGTMYPLGDLPSNPPLCMYWRLQECPGRPRSGHTMRNEIAACMLIIFAILKRVRGVAFWIDGSACAPEDLPDVVLQLDH